MKKDIHPVYRPVVFIDTTNGKKFLCGSTVVTTQKADFEGKEYDAYMISVSSASHPFFTGSQKFVDAQGRIEKFRNRYEKAASPVKKEEDFESKETVAKKTLAKKAASTPGKKKALRARNKES